MVILKHYIPVIKFLECNPADISLPWSNATKLFSQIPYPFPIVRPTPWWTKTILTLRKTSTLVNYLFKSICLFIFTLFTVDLKLLDYRLKTLFIAATVITELIDVNFVTEQETESFPKEFLESGWTNWQTHTFLHTLIKETFKGMPPFLCSEFSGVQCIKRTCYRYILQSRHSHCKSTNFSICLLKILKDYDNLISLRTRNCT